LFSIFAHCELFVIENADQSQMVKLIEEGFDVRGLFDQSIFLFSEKPINPSVSLGDPNAFSYVVIQGDSFSFEWARMLVDIRLQHRLHLLYNIRNLVLLGVFDKSFEDLSSVIFIPRSAEYISLPITTISLPRHQIFEKPRFVRSIPELINTVTEASLREILEHLTNESGSGISTRHSYSTGARTAGLWAIEQFEEWGFNATTESFGGNYCPNIIAQKLGLVNPEQIVVIGAHLDCRNANLNDAQGTAPGANDDGSGSAAVLQAAKSIFTQGAQFRSTIRLALWCGEEQGLVGSRAHAIAARNEQQQIVAMFQADMIGYQAYAQPQCAFVNRYTDLSLTNYSKEIAEMYVPGIQRVDTSACCSDHQSFYENGFPSVGFVEGGGYTIDPRYHHVLDLANREGFSFNQIRSVTQIMLASAAEIAGYIE